MRLNRLDLIRYGRFRDAKIELPQPDDGEPDFTLIYGSNEAGKSTTFTALLDLFFGMKSGAHPYAFRFDRKDLLIGAELSIQGRGDIAFRRNSKPTHSLLDTNDRPINEAVLSAALHGLDRESYEERFSLNEKSLREGGERIARAQGDLGQLLHAGLSGLTGMAQSLDILTARADNFYKKRGRSTVLRIGSDRLKEISRELRAERLTTDRERKLRQDRDRALGLFEKADADMRLAQQRQAASHAAEIWHDRTLAINRLNEMLLEFPSGPDLPEGLAEHVAGLVEQIAALNIRISEAERVIVEQDQIIAENPTDSLAEHLRVELEKLDQLYVDGAPLMSRASTAKADLVRRITDRDNLKIEMESVLTTLQSLDSDPIAFTVDLPFLEQITELVQDYLATALSARAAVEAVEAARAQQGDTPVEPQDMTALRTAFDSWKSVGDISILEADHDKAVARLNRAAATLPTSWATLVSSGLPARETLDDASNHWAEISALLSTSQQELNDRETELTAARESLDAQQTAPQAVDIVRTEETRRRRDVVWHQHRNSLTADTAEKFEAAMTMDDHVRAHYLTGAEARQRLAAAQAQASAAQAKYLSAKSRFDALCIRRDQLIDRCAKLAHAVGLETDVTPSAFLARHRALEIAAEAAAEKQNAQDALNRGLERKQMAHEQLVIAALPHGLHQAHGELPILSQRALSLEENNRKVWAKWLKSQETFAALTEKAKQRQIESDDLKTQLDTLTAILPLPDRSAPAISAALPHLRRLQQLRENYLQLNDRISSLQQAIDMLADVAMRLMQSLAEENANVECDPVHIISLARTCVRQAEAIEEKRSSAISLRAKAEAVRSRALAEYNEANGNLETCFNQQGGQDLGPRDRVAKLAARDKLRAKLTILDDERQKARSAVSAKLFKEELDLMPSATRPSDVEQILKDAQASRDAARDSNRETERLYNDAYEMADHGDLVTEQATLREELRTGARQAAVDRLAQLGARGALRRLAAERRSDMLQDVEDAFVTMTKPAWTGVDVWSAAEGEKLIGIQPDGGTVPVDQMSTGTMGQLYFALRLAGYRNFTRELGALPMILDDVMETFDNTRAQAALKLCADIGATGQAVMFTHHAHLVALARDCIPKVSIVNMPN